MARKKTTESKRPIESYEHQDKQRVNNPPVGLVTPETDPDAGAKKTYAYDPHLDPALSWDQQNGRKEIEERYAQVRALTSAVKAAFLELARAKQDGVTEEGLTLLQEKANALIDQATDAAAALEKLQLPYLQWAGKAEHTSFEVPTVSLHVHERIDPRTIIEAVRKRNGSGQGAVDSDQLPLFVVERKEPLRQAIEFYKHPHGWSNRLVAGDSLLVMNSLLEKEGMAGKVQMIYFDPPYGIKYGSNFQPFVNKRDVKDGKDEDLTAEPEQIRAFRDTWELGIHSYLTYLRDRLLLARELLTESGSVFVQISDENVHHVRELMDEVFGAGNCLNVIPFVKTSGVTTKFLASNVDFLLWYGKDRALTKYRALYLPKSAEAGTAENYGWIELEKGERRGLTAEEKRDRSRIPDGARIYKPDNIGSQGNPMIEFEYRGKVYQQPWKTNREGMTKLAAANRLHVAANSLQYVRYITDFPCLPVTQLWDDTGTGSFTDDKIYVVQTGAKVIQRCLLMTTDPSDLVFDPTCGSGTTATVAEQWGRRWITCDTSRVATTLAKQRLMTASFDYYALRYPHEGLKGGFDYETVPHITLKSIANNPDIDTIHAEDHPKITAALAALNAALAAAPPIPFRPAQGVRKGKPVSFRDGETLHEWEVPFDWPLDRDDTPLWPAAARAPFDAFHTARQAMQRRMDASIQAHAEQETLYDKPRIDRNRLRITGPFSVEAVPAPTVLSLDDSLPPAEANDSIARTGETSRQSLWRDELLKTGVRAKGGARLTFAEFETLPGLRHLHASGSLTDTGERVVVSFGPEHAALEQRQVELALTEAETLRPAPKFILFCAFTFDPEAAKDIDEVNWPGVTLLKAQMNTDLLTEDLKKARSSNQSFWLMGQPDVELRKRKDGMWEVEVNGFDYFDPRAGDLVSGGKKQIAMWSLDTDYDQRSLMPHQVFFPMADAKGGWNRLKATVRSELDEDLLEQFHGTVSLPFEAGDNRRIAVKIVDDRGIESLKIMPLED